MTAEWEKRPLLIEKGQLGGNEFLRGITELIGQMLAECEKLPAEKTRRFRPREETGKCPVCGRPVYEGKKNFYCSDRECAFSLWKENRYLSGMLKMNHLPRSGRGGWFRQEENRVSGWRASRFSRRENAQQSPARFHQKQYKRQGNWRF